MKITCQSCQAKYTIADDKVVGKTVKIKCKKCGSAIVVQGDAAQAAYAAQADGDDGAETRVFSESAAAGAAPTGAGEWLVNVAEGDERSMTGAQIADEYARGTINHETYVWKDGMSDWLMLSTVPELMQAIAAQAPAPAPAYGHPAVQEPALGLMGTVMMDSASASAPAAAAAPRPMSTPPAAAAPAPAAAAAAPAAARRANNRGGVDVFGARQEAEAVPVAMPSAPPPGGSMTGQRNENSVLFSLSALTATENAVKAQEEKAVMEPRPGPTGRPPPTRNGSGARAGFDDIMNLGGGGIGSPMLAPPPVLAPVVEAPPPPPMPSVAPAMGAGMGMPMGVPDYPQPKKSPVGLIIGGVVALLVIGGVAAAALGVFSPAPEPVASNDPAPTTTQANNNPTPTTTEAKPAETAPAETKPAETAAAKPAETTTVAAATTPGGPKPGGPLPTGPGGAKPAEKEPPKEEKPATPPKEEKPATPPAGDSSAEFNRGAATSALGAAAGAAKGCKKPDGPTGTGKVKVTFAPSGNVTSAQVQGAPFAGTPVGGCVASAFRSARVPAFSGAPVSVTKSFTIN